MAISRRDIVQMLRDENDLLKIRNKQVGSRLARLQQAFRVLSDIDENTHKLSSSLDITALFSQLLQLVLHTCNTDNGSLILLDEKTQELEFVEVIGESRDALLNHRININTGIVGQAVRTGQAILIEDVHSSKQWSSSIDDYLSFHTESLICAPLKINDRTIGAIELVHHSSDGMFDENDLNVLRVAACYVSRAMEQAEKQVTSVEITP